MAQAGYTPIKLYYSTTGSAVPNAANLEPGELALNINDMKLYCENSSGVVTLLASAGGATGDVVGPASATDNAIARFDLTTGKLIQNSVVTIADTTGDIAGAGSITSTSASGILTRAAATQDGVELAGRAGGTSSYKVTFTPTTLSASQTLTLPDASGTILQSGTAVTVGQGGTGLTTLTANNVILGNGSSNVQFVAPGANGNILTSNGTTWTSATPAGGGALTNNTRQAVTSSATTTINLNSGNVIDLTMAANITTLSFTNVPASGTPILIQIVVRNASDGTAYTITWPNSVYWSGQYSATTISNVQTAPTLATGGNGVTVIALLTTDGGTKFRGWVEATIPGGVEAGIYSWGRAYFGALGTNSTSPDVSSPVQIGALTNWGGPIVGRSQNFVAIKNDGTMWSWGRNQVGQLGINSTANRSSPVQIGSLTSWSNVLSSPSASFVVAKKTDGTLWAWGENGSGQLGDGTVVYRSSPVQIGALTDWQLASAGRSHCLAVKTDGTLWAWGGNANFQIGDQTNIFRSSPVQIGALTTWVSPGAGYNASYVINASGELWAWGYNGVYGRLGQNNNTTNNFSSPTQVGSLTNWSKIFPGHLGWFALKTDGTLWGCGSNSQGRLGDNTTTSRSSPVQITSDTNWLQATTSSNNPCSGAVKTNGTLWTWGRSLNYGQPARTTAVSSPTQVGSDTNWLQVRMGGDSTVGTRGNQISPA